MDANLPASWRVRATPQEPLPAEAAALLTELLAACDPHPEVRAISIEDSEGGPAFRVWLTAFVGALQLELDRLQAAHRSLIVIAVRLPAGSTVPTVSPSERLYTRMK